MEQELVQEQYPVCVRYAGHGTWETTELDFSDYSKMSVHIHKLDSARQFERPEWAVKPELLGQVVAKFLEHRAGYRTARKGSIKERIQFAERLLKDQVPKLQAMLALHCKRYMRAKRNGGGTQSLAILIENIDTRIRIANKGAALITGIVSYYYLQGWDSVQTSAVLGIKPPHCRQILYRLGRIWALINGEYRPARPKATNKLCDKCGDKFKPTRGARQRYCSEACRETAAYERCHKPRPSWACD
jgi:hypothetical protein